MVSTLKIELNGTLITGRIDGIENFTITYRRRDEEGNLAASFSSELTFYDDGYQLINQLLIQDPNGFNKEVNVTIFDDCCSKPVFSGVILGESIDWCSDGCYVSANIVEKSPELNCVKSTLIYDNHNGFLNRKNHPIIRYCIDVRPAFIGHLLFLVGIIISAVINTILTPVILVLKFIDWVFNSDAADEVIEWQYLTAQWYYNCGDFHPSAYLRDYIKNVCAKCGLTFQSSILNGDNSSNFPWGTTYYNSVFMNAPVQGGKAWDNTDYGLISANLPIETLDTFMTRYLEPLFNAEYRIVNGILIFERKDYFFTNNEWINANDLLLNGKLDEDKICWSWIDKERYSFGDFRYSLDPIEYIGNEVIDRWSDIVEWNPAPINTNQKGFKAVNPQISPIRTRTDFFKGGPNPLWSVYDTFQLANSFIINIIFLFGRNPFNNYTEAAVLAQNTFALPKIVIYDASKGNGKNGGLVSAYMGTNAGAPLPLGSARNYPYWFAGPPYTNNLYDYFHKIDNPRLPSAERYNFNFTFDFECDSFDTFSFDKTVGGLNLNGAVVTGKINEIVVNFTNRTIKVTGIV